MTSIEWLVEQVNSDCLNSTFIRQDIIKQAKEMHKQEIKKVFEYGVTEGVLTDINYLKCTEEAEQYYQETFVSKGSEYKYHEQSRGINVDSFDSVAPKKDKYIVKVTEVELPQQEISDEEIEKAVNEYADAYQCPSQVSMCKHDVISAWNNAIKWYKEQLKSNGNGK